MESSKVVPDLAQPPSKMGGSLNSDCSFLLPK